MSVDGSTSLNDITDWKIGDWAVYGTASNWGKVDNTSTLVSINGAFGTPTLNNTSVGSGASIVKDTLTTNLRLKSITTDTTVDITSNTDDLEIKVSTRLASGKIIANGALLVDNQICEVSGTGLVSVAKANSYNRPFGTIAETILEGDTVLGTTETLVSLGGESLVGTQVSTEFKLKGLTSTDSSITLSNTANTVNLQVANQIPTTGTMTVINANIDLSDLSGLSGVFSSNAVIDGDRLFIISGAGNVIPDPTDQLLAFDISQETPKFVSSLSGANFNDSLHGTKIGKYLHILNNTGNNRYIDVSSAGQMIETVQAPEIEYAQLFGSTAVGVDNISNGTAHFSQFPVDTIDRTLVQLNTVDISASLTSNQSVKAVLIFDIWAVAFIADFGGGGDNTVAIVKLTDFTYENITPTLLVGGAKLNCYENSCTNVGNIFYTASRAGASGKTDNVSRWELVVPSNGLVTSVQFNQTHEHTTGMTNASVVSVSGDLAFVGYRGLNKFSVFNRHTLAVISQDITLAFFVVAFGVRADRLYIFGNVDDTPDTANLAIYSYGSFTTGDISTGLLQSIAITSSGDITTATNINASVLVASRGLFVSGDALIDDELNCNSLKCCDVACRVPSDNIDMKSNVSNTQRIVGHPAILAVGLSGTSVGTIAQNFITGTTTAFLSEVRIGDIIHEISKPAELYRVSIVVSDTVVNVVPNLISSTSGGVVWQRVVNNGFEITSSTGTLHMAVDQEGTTLIQDLSVLGSMTLSATSIISGNGEITISDNLIKLAHNNNSDLSNFGVSAQYGDGSPKYSGLARYHSDKEWYLFKNKGSVLTTTTDLSNETLAALNVSDLNVDSGTLDIKSDGDFKYQMAFCEAYLTTLNAVETVITTQNVWVKCNLNASVTAGASQGWVCDNTGRCTYNATRSRYAHVGCTFSAHNASKKIIDFAIFRDGVIQTGSTVSFRTEDNQKAGSTAIHTIGSPMIATEYLELWCRNTEGNGNITVSHFNFFAMGLPNVVP